MTKVVCYIEQHLSVHVDPDLAYARTVNGDITAGDYTLSEALNIAYGFSDGNCCEKDAKGVYVYKPAPPGTHEALEAARFKLERSFEIRIRFVVYSDGTIHPVGIVNETPKSKKRASRTRK